MDNSRAAVNSDIESILGGHVWNNASGIPACAILVSEVLRRPDSFVGISDRTTDAITTLEKLVDDVEALPTVRSNDQNK